MDIKRWYHLNDHNYDISYADIDYSGTKWGKSRRVVIVRTIKKDAPKNKQLFTELEEFDKYEFKCFVTNTTMSAIDVHKKYNERGDCENRIKELKYDFGMEGFSLKNFGAMEAAFRFVMVAYNVMAIFKQAILDKKGYKYLSTIRFQCIAIGSYLVRSAGKSKLMLGAKGERKHFLEHIFSKFETIKPPYSFSNA